MLVNSAHSKNACFPMLVTPSGMLILVNSAHSKNALSPMLVTLFGIVMLVKPVQF